MFYSLITHTSARIVITRVLRKLKELERKPEVYTFEEFCKAIFEDEFDSEQNIALSSVFGIMMRKMLVNVRSFTDTSFLENLYAADHIVNIVGSVASFLNVLSVNEIYKKVKTLNAYEYLLSLAVTNYISPLNFALNLISYFISGSRNIVDIGSLYSLLETILLLQGILTKTL